MQHKPSKASFFTFAAAALTALALLAGCGGSSVANEDSSERSSEHSPDALITTAVTAKLAADPQVNPFKIDVDTAEGVVSLTGTVNQTEDRDQAETLARDTKGVKDVINNLKVAEKTDGETLLEDSMDKAGEALSNAADTATSEVDDAAITTAVTAKLAADPQVNPFKIDVDTAEGVVSLTGTVSKAEARKHAEELARDTKGVKDVINNLEVEKD